MLVSVGFVSGSGGPTFDCKVQESTDGTTWTEISWVGFANTTVAATTAAITQITTAATTAPAVPITVGPFQRTKRYLRGIATIAGTTSPLYAGGVEVIEQFKVKYTGTT
jgi:hypothetical protein